MSLPCSPVSPVPPPEGAAGAAGAVVPAPLASVPRRMVQFLLDVVGVAVLGLGVWFLEHGGHLAAVLAVPYPQVQNVAIPALYGLVLVVVPMVSGRTPAMALLGMRVRDAGDRGRVGAARLLVRGLLTWVDALLLGLVAVVAMVWTPRRQRVGDLVARTVVERVR